jgi:hypothetical protein
MLAVDTDVVIRFLVNDDAAQHKRAVALFERHAIWLAKTVLLDFASGDGCACPKGSKRRSADSDAGTKLATRNVFLL